MPDLPAGTVTFLFTDVEGSTQLWEQYPDTMRLALALHDACLRGAIESHHGRVFKTIGDQFCAAFADPAEALHAAIAAQRALATDDPMTCRGDDLTGKANDHPAPIDSGHQVIRSSGHQVIIPLRVRMALHTGAAELREEDYFGPTLNRVARLLVVGHGGQVLLSQSTADQVRDKLPPEVSLRDLGLHRLRDLLRPEQVYQLVHPDLPADFLPLRSLGALSHNLPQQVTRFVGREREMAEIQQLLAATRVLTLTGTGGAGKTRLALQVAAELLSGYEDGVWLVELAALVDPAQVPQAVAAALQVREEPRRPLTQTLVEALQPRQLLLILDNCEHLLAASAGLVDALVRACPHLRILATSRERLNIQGEQTYRVPSLTTPDPRALPVEPEDADLAAAVARFEAVQMFVDRAALVESSFTLTPQNAPAVAEVCHQLGGIPLAIELAAARLKVLPVEQIAPRLNDIFRVLSAGSRTALPRQQTLRALIDWSYDFLSEAEQTLLRRLSVFAGGFTLEAAEAVCPGEKFELDDVLDLLGQLVEKSLVLVDEQEPEPRYRLLETIRQYASEKLWEAGEGAVARWRYRGWFLRLAEQTLSELYGPQQVGLWRADEPFADDRTASGRQRLVVEYDNLRAALGPAARTHPPRETGGERGDLPLLPTRLARWGQVVEQLAPTYRRLGRGERARGVLEDYIALCQAEKNAAWLARAYTLMGQFLLLNGPRTGETTPRAMYERAIELCEAHGLHEILIEPGSHLAYELAAGGADLERAEAMARACLPQAEVLPDTLPLRRLHTSLLWIAIHQADWPAFQSAFRASLAGGGPLETPLHLMLTRIEDRFHRQGADAQFIEVCRELAEGYAHAGLPVPFNAWFLEAAVPRPLPGEPWLREEFDAEQWHPSLRWLDATGRSRIDRTTRPGWLGLYPTAGANLWPFQDLDAPRLVATVTGDFVAQTRLELGAQTQVLAGLLVWRDEAHFARLELQLRSLEDERPTVQLEACVAGQFRIHGRGQIERQPDSHAAGGWLRIEREGEELRAWCSADGEHWMTCGAVRFSPGETEQVGLAVISHGPNAHAWFDTFLLWRGSSG